MAPRKDDRRTGPGTAAPPPCPGVDGRFAAAGRRSL